VISQDRHTRLVLIEERCEQAINAWIESHDPSAYTEETKQFIEDINAFSDPIQVEQFRDYCLGVMKNRIQVTTLQ
jgi:hypothetical protein